MSDEDRFLEDDEQEGIDDVEVGRKVGILPAFVIKILQIAAISLGALILVVTVSVITFNVLIKGRGAGTSPQVESPEYSDAKEKYSYFSNITAVRGQTADDPPKTFSATLVIGYKLEDKAIVTELLLRVNQIRNLILKYLAGKMGNELGPKYYDFLETELKRMINDLMVEKIDEVLFTELQTF